MNAAGALRKRVMLVALAVATALTVGLGVGVTQAQAISDNSGTIEVTGLESGVSVTAYQVIDVNYDFESADQPVDPVYVWDSAVASWVSTNYSSYIDTSDNSVTSTFQTLEDSEAQSFYDALAAAIRGGTISLDAAATETADAEGATTLGGLDMGSYLLLFEGGEKVYQVSVVNVLPTWSDTDSDGTKDAWVQTTSELEVKSSEPSISKVISSSDGTNSETSATVQSTGIGETVSYTLTVTLPTYLTSAINDDFVISDVLDDGLTVDTSTIKVYGTSVSDDTLITNSDTTTYYTLTTTDGTTLVSDSEIAVDFQINLDYDAVTASGYTTIVVTYDATVDSDAEPSVAYSNTAYLEYSNNPYGTSSSSTATYKVKTAADTTAVYTYGIQLTKISASDSSERLAGAQFTMTDSNSNTLYFKLDSTSGVYYYAGTSSGDGLTSTLESDSSGLITVYGLDTGSYTLAETKAPDGYSKLASSISLAIADDDLDGQPTGKVDSTDVEESSDGLVSFKVSNTDASTFSLPTTGGIGTIIFTIAGVVLIAVAIAVFVGIRRRNRDEA